MGNSTRTSALFCTLLIMLFSSSSHAQSADYTRTLVPQVLGEWEAEVSPPPPDLWLRNMPARSDTRALPFYALRIAYVVPSNRTPQSQSTERIRYLTLQSIEFYREQMERNGFAAKSYTPETEADGVTPKVHVVNAPNTDAYFNVDPWGRVATACQNAGLPVWSPKQTWMIIFEGLIMNPDGTITGNFNGGASFGSGDDGGVGMTTGASIALATTSDLVNNTAYHGLTIPGWGPYPMQYGVTSPSFDGSTLSSLSSVWRGVLTHEVHHGFGIGHDFRNDSNFNGNIMGNGFRGMRGWVHPNLYPNDETRLGYADALVLNVHRLFNPATTYSDNTKPALSITSSGSVAPVNGLLPINFTASDAGGLAFALLRLDGNTVGEMLLSSTSTSTAFNTAWYTAGATNSFSISVYDVNGNRQNADVTLTPMAGSNAAPRPFITIKPSCAAPGENVTFSAQQSVDPGASIASTQVEWDLNNDGIYDTAPTTTKTYVTTFPNPGTRLVRARLTDSLGAVTVSTPVALRIAIQTTAANDWQLFE